jgi:transcriptional regulator of acetoin/glycerol metabolism
VGQNRVTHAEIRLHDVVMLGAQPLVFIPEPAPDALQPPMRRFIRAQANCAWNWRRPAKPPTALPRCSSAEKTGTGKEWASRFIHERDPDAAATGGRQLRALPRVLLESELFGHVRGAFTGADGARTGLVAQASGGTLFLDESPNCRGSAGGAFAFSENRTFRPVARPRNEIRCPHRGGHPRDLPQRAARGLFREDLLYAFEIRLELPPLARRKLDFPC